jgi:hypothetical protein
VNHKHFCDGKTFPFKWKSGNNKKYCGGNEIGSEPEVGTQKICKKGAN